MYDCFENEEDIIKAFPRRPAMKLFAAKWPGGKGCEVSYFGPFTAPGVYVQNNVKAIVIGDAVYITLGERKNYQIRIPPLFLGSPVILNVYLKFTKLNVGPDTFPAELAPMKHCRWHHPQKKRVA